MATHHLNCIDDDGNGFPLGIGSITIPVVVPWTEIQPHIQEFEGPFEIGIFLPNNFPEYDPKTPRLFAVDNVTDLEDLRSAMPLAYHQKYFDSGFEIYGDNPWRQDIEFDLVIDTSDRALSTKYNDLIREDSTQTSAPLVAETSLKDVHGKELFWSACNLVPVKVQDSLMKGLFEIRLKFVIVLVQKIQLGSTSTPILSNPSFVQPILFSTQLGSTTKITAVDFGNTASNIFLLNPQDEKPKPQSLFDSPQDSSVFFRRFSDSIGVDEDYLFENQRNRLENIRTDEFKETEAGDWGRVVRNPKRLIGLDSPEFCMIEDQLGDSIAISSLLPSEAKISELFAELYRSERKKCGSLVATYPTTYLKKEIDLLERAIIRAQFRAAGREFYDEDEYIAMRRNEVPEDDNDEQVGSRLLMIDEASASAFFYCYEAIIENKGSHGFQFVYGDSTSTILIIDIGGGTTDVVIVQCKMSPPLQNGEVNIEVTPLHRTGLRDFGGDDITAAFFKVAKTAIANLKHPEEFQKLDPQPSGQDFDFSAFYESQKEIIESIVQTNFDPESISDDDEFNRMLRTCAIFKFAEALKKHVSGDAPDSSFIEEYSESKILFDDSPLFVTEDCIKTTLTWVRDGYVDSLIQESLMECIERINVLIEYYLESKNTFIDHVYLVGNASRYQNIKNKIREKLRFFEFGFDLIRDIEIAPNESDGYELVKILRHMGDLEFEHDMTNLKDAVVKGAAYAKMLEERVINLKLKRIIDLSDRMPAKFYWRSVDQPDGQDIIQVGESLKEMNRKWRKLGEFSPHSQPFVLSVFREFEGESSKAGTLDDGKAFLQFKFERMISNQNDGSDVCVHFRYVHDPDNLDKEDHFEMTFDPDIRAGSDRNAKEHATWIPRPTGQTEYFKATVKGEYQQNTPILPPMLRGNL